MKSEFYVYRFSFDISLLPIAKTPRIVSSSGLPSRVHACMGACTCTRMFLWSHVSVSMRPSAGCSHRAPRLGFRHSRGGSQPSITQVPGESLWTRTGTHLVHVHTCRQNGHIHEIKWIHVNKSGLVLFSTLTRQFWVQMRWERLSSLSTSCTLLLRSPCADLS